MKFVVLHACWFFTIVQGMHMLDYTSATLSMNIKITHKKYTKLV